MTTINDILKLYSQILEIFNKYGFYDVVIFKGFSNKEKHNLNLLLSDQFTADTELKPQTMRKLAVKDELTSLLKCKIVLTTHDQMESYYLEKLNSSNSVKLTKVLSSQSIKAVFGHDWAFNPLDEAVFWGASSFKKIKESEVEEQAAPSETLLKELRNYIEKKTQQSSAPVNLDEIFAELKQAVLPSIYDSVDTSNLQKITLVK